MGETIKSQIKITGLIYVLTACPLSISAQEAPAQELDLRRQAQDTWLRLEGERDAYRATQPARPAQSGRLRELRLQQQGLRDRQRLDNDRRTGTVQRQQRSIPLNSAPSTRGGTAGARRSNQIQLQNRMQRHSWSNDR